jgi:Mrp family chromosome partitioning ATPase
MDIIREAVRKLSQSAEGSDVSTDDVPALESTALFSSHGEEFETNRSLSADELSDLRISHGAMRDENVYSAFSKLRTHIVQKLGKNNCSIAVSSVCPGGGASFVALNLAAAFASDATRSALLVDCNFSGDRYEELGDNKDIPGITDFIGGPAVCSIESLMFDIGIPRLRLLAGGRMRDSRVEFFTRPRAKQMFDEICTQNANRAVIVDVPPPSMSAYANVIATYCDAVLLVVPYGQVTQQDVRVAARAFPREKIIGSVFNDIPHWRTPK